MPELPEVETTLRGIAPHILNQLRRNRPPAQAALANPARAARNPAWACRARMPPPRQISADSF